MLVQVITAWLCMVCLLFHHDHANALVAVSPLVSKSTSGAALGGVAPLQSWNKRHGSLRNNKTNHYDRKTTLFMAKPSSPVSLIGKSKNTLQQVMTLCMSSVAWVLNEISNLEKPQKYLMLGVFVFGFALGRVRPFWKRFLSTLDIPASYYNKGSLKGRVASVSDGDTIRFLHVPTLLHPKRIDKKKQKLSETTLPVRICTIDTPETAKFGKSGQPYGIEAKEHLTKLLQDKPIYIQILQKDQYSRIVCQVFTKLFFKKVHVDEEMLKAGLAEVYQGGGAVYGPRGLEYYLQLEKEAQDKKVGMWSQGKKRESAADYKKRTK